MKKARRGFAQEPYDCQYEWADDCFVQCGGSGIVLNGGLEKTLGSKTVGEIVDNLKENYSYTTAFFEAFPRNPDTFIRGEGATIEEAETKAWNAFMKFSACEHPEFEKRKFRNGAGFCVKCGMFKSKAFKPWEKCVVCKKPTFYHQVDENTVMCKKDFYNLPYEQIGTLKYLYDEEEWIKHTEEAKLNNDYNED